MPIYQFEAMDTPGGEVKDTVEAATEEEAQWKIRRMGYFVTRITEVADANLEAESTSKPAEAKPNPDSDSEFGLTLDESDSQLEPAEKIFETDFEVPALDESGPARAPH